MISQTYIQIGGQLLQLLGFVILAAEWLAGRRRQVGQLEVENLKQSTKKLRGLEKLQLTESQIGSRTLHEDFSRRMADVRIQIRRLIETRLSPKDADASLVQDFLSSQNLTTDQVLEILETVDDEKSRLTTEFRAWIFLTGTVIVAVGMILQLMGSWPGCCRFLGIQS